MSPLVTIALITALTSVTSALIAGISLVKSSQIRNSIGPTNGQNIYQLLKAIQEFEGYVHTRNHDLMNHLSTLTLQMHVIIKTLDELKSK